MAANLYGSCVKCNKSSGILLCTGCNKTLCFEHVSEHKKEIDQNLEDLINEENQFENNLSKSDDSHYLFTQIDQWKKETIEQIKQIAKKAKEDLRELINKSHQELFKDLEIIKENLRLLKESEDLSEIQLIKLTNQFNQFKEKINSFQLIKSSNSHFLRVEKIGTNQNPPVEKSPTSTEKLSSNSQLTHSKQEGSIIISEIDPYGYYITIEHNGLSTDKQQDMCGWTLKRSIDSYEDIIYRFPTDFILKGKSSVQILSRQASQTIYSYKKENILVADSIRTWGTGVKRIINTLFDPNGNEKHILIQSFIFS